MKGLQNIFANWKKRNFVQTYLSFIEKEDGKVLFDQDETVKETKYLL